MSGTYPIFKDNEFNLKIHAKKEFRDYQNTDIIDTNFDKKFDDICNADFELTNHQYFVKNYLSPNTPYNSLLLFHGLGTGKTCSAISICEEIRKIYKRTAYNKRIIIIASPNVQDNFKTQLFDSSKLKKENNVWKLDNTCVGNIILNELFPKQNNNLSKEIIINSVKRFINTHYLFMGYIEFANYVKKLQDRKKSLQKEFDNRLIVIDEVHNMKTTADTKNTYCAEYLQLLVDNVKFMKLVFLTATPMFNSHLEIFEIINLMRLNDNLEKIDESIILDKEGNFIIDPETGEETGLQLFIEYTRGYISYVRGENPYSFPFRIWPMTHSPNQSLKQLNSYPTYTPNKTIISDNDKLKYLDLYITPLLRNTFQFNAYQLLKSISDTTRISHPSIMNPMNQILNFAYPDSINENYKKHTSLYGKEGMIRLMQYNESTISNNTKGSETIRKVQYTYKQSTLTEYGKIFHPDIIGQYSHKLKNISNLIPNSNGIILIYSQFIEGGLIPTALMLEELGFNRYDGENLLKSSEKTSKLSHKYVIISGDKRFSPNNEKSVAACSTNTNINGSVIKVILISKAASEGIDFKFIREVHILDPWYNLNRNEQIVGRAVRMCSHKNIPFAKRNVSIFYHTTYIDDNEEASDLFMYRLCEKKAIQISKISRLLKRNAVDCMLNTNQTTFTKENFNKIVNITLSNNKNVDFNVGDKPYTLFCDFDNTCSYDCINNSKIFPSSKPLPIDNSTYNFTLLESNIDNITQQIIRYFSTHHGVTTFNHLNSVFHKNPDTLIKFAVDKLVNSEQIIYDILNREGTLTVFGDYILFNPLNLYSNSSVYDRLHPYHGKHSKVPFQYKLNFISNEFFETILQNINTSLNLAFSDKIDDKELRLALEQNNWYSIANHFLNEINNSNTFLILAIYGHLLDELNIDDKIKVINFVYNDKIHTQYTQFLNLKHIQMIKNYIESKIFDFMDTKAIIIQHDETELFVLHDNVWLPSTFEEKKTYTNLFKKDVYEKMNNLNIQQNTIGFIQKHNETYIYKLKNMTDKKSTGYRCTQSKRPIIEDICFKLLEQLIKYETEQNIPITFNKNILENTAKKSKKETKNFEICVLLELLLRLSHFQNLNQLSWFLDTFNQLTISAFMKFSKQKISLT